MFPWSDTCQSARLRRTRRLSDEQDLLDQWTQEVCCGEELPEVEIISLLHEQIPRYRLRADTLTQFTGYENQDWFVPSPALKPEDFDAAALTSDQIRETLNYFLKYDALESAGGPEDPEEEDGFVYDEDEIAQARGQAPSEDEQLLLEVKYDALESAGGPEDPEEEDGFVYDEDEIAQARGQAPSEDEQLLLEVKYDALESAGGPEDPEEEDGFVYDEDEIAQARGQAPSEDEQLLLEVKYDALESAGGPEDPEEEDGFVYDEDEIAQARGQAPSEDEQLLLEVLCSNRVSQMTKTYNDIEAVTRLLEEKEKDIELTARIGKELLGHNQKLEANVASLEGELRAANEKIIQLTHELTKKTELIQILTNDVDDSGSEPGTPAGTVNWDVLQRRLCRLEEENKSLRSEASQLATQTEECEAQEARLVAELASQLALARGDLSGVALDADRQREEAANTKALADTLTDKLSQAEAKISAVTQENDELVQMVNLARETQGELATELAELKERYSEVVNLLHEAQDTLRKQRKKSQPQARGGLLFPSLHTSVPAHNPDSLASELECSLFSENSLDSGFGASSLNLPNYKKVFETVRCASRAGSLGSDSSAGGSPGPGPRYPTLANTGPLSVSSSQRPRMSSSYLPPHRLTRPALDSAGASDSECSDNEYSYMSRSRLSGPAQSAPGDTAQDLEAALRRLTPGAVAARRAALSAGLTDHELDCRTPDSIMSTGSSGAYSGLLSWKLPDKLQIVKPLEGSATLHHWSELATPSLGGLLEERPGVKVRGGLELEQLGLELYTLSDLEEDDEVSHPGKSFGETGAVYTYTNSTVMHPDDNTSVTHSYRGSQMCTATTSRVSSVASTPAIRSRRNSTSTFSSSLGLAKMLNERGIKAVTPSTLPTPMFSPTATPTNSPDHSPLSSPDQSRSPSPSPTASSSYSPLGIPGFLMSSGADLLRRTLIGSSPSPPPLSRKAEHASRSRTVARSTLKSGPGIVETLERIGLEKIMSTIAENQPAQSTPSTSTAEPLGVPGTPGTGALKSRLSQLPSATPDRRAKRQARVRPDLGTVPNQTNNASNTPLGTLSAMLFGRKGGLL